MLCLPNCERKGFPEYVFTYLLSPHIHPIGSNLKHSFTAFTWFAYLKII